MSQTARNPKFRLLEQEANHLVSLVKNRDFTQVVGTMIFLPGAPGLGGTLVYNQKYGSRVTCTVIPVADGPLRVRNSLQGSFGTYSPKRLRISCCRTWTTPARGNLYPNWLCSKTSPCSLRCPNGVR